MTITIENSQTKIEKSGFESRSWRLT